MFVLVVVFIVLFCKGDDKLYLWKLILWVEFLTKLTFFSFMCFLFSLVYFFKPPVWSVVIHSTLLGSCPVGMSLVVKDSSFGAK